MKSYSSRELLKLLQQDGWVIADARGSHVHLVHPTKPGKITVPHPRDSHKPKTLRTILKQAGLPQ